MKSHGYFYGIDLVRFLSAIAVAVFHLNWRNPNSMNLAPWGWVGVEVFFVISGIVIAGSAKKADFEGFVLGRFLRLYPAAWICALISLLVLFSLGVKRLSDVGVTVHPSLEGVVGSIILFSPESFRLASAYWTLPIEISFYSLVALLLLFNKRSYLSVVARVLAFAGIPVLLLETARILHFVDYSWMSFRMGMENATLLRHASYFSLGMLLQENLESSGEGSFFSRVCLWTAIAVSSAFIIIRAYFTEIGYATHLSGGFVHTALLALFVFLLALVLLDISLRFNDRINLPPWAAGLFRTLGLITYPIYLMHETVGGTGVQVASQWGAPFLVAFPFAMLVVIGVSLVVVRLEAGFKLYLKNIYLRVKRYWLGVGEPAEL